MKKMALFFIIISVGILNGMENPDQVLNEEKNVFKNLPQEVKGLILLAFAQSGNDLDLAIHNIKLASRTSKALNQMLNLGNIKGFTAIVAQLQKRFEGDFRLPRKEIAEKFNTQTAQEYIKLGQKLLVPANRYYENSKDVKVVEKALAKGADPNYSTMTNAPLYGTHAAIMNNMTDDRQKRNETLITIFKLLLQAGAKDENLMFYEAKRINKLNKNEIKTPEANLRRELFKLLQQYE
jgi:hypothetical protein